MYLLTTDAKTPFAIVENDKEMRIEKAIAEEFLIDEVGSIGEFILPDWGETRVISYLGITDEGDEEIFEIGITKLVTY